jgi:hypothetical protein
MYKLAGLKELFAHVRAFSNSQSWSQKKHDLAMTINSHCFFFTSKHIYMPESNIEFYNN